MIEIFMEHCRSANSRTEIRIGSTFDSAQILNFVHLLRSTISYGATTVHLSRITLHKKQSHTTNGIFICNANTYIQSQHIMIKSTTNCINIQVRIVLTIVIVLQPNTTATRIDKSAWCHWPWLNVYFKNSLTRTTTQAIHQMSMELHCNVLGHKGEIVLQ